MQPKKLTPLEILQKQKNELQAKSDELSGNVENRIKYIQQNFAPLLRDTVIDTAVSKLPLQVRGIAGSFLKKEQKVQNEQVTDLQTVKSPGLSKLLLGVVSGAVEVAPMIIRRKKVILISLLLKQFIKRVAK